MFRARLEQQISPEGEQQVMVDLLWSDPCASWMQSHTVDDRNLHDLIYSNNRSNYSIY